MSFRLDSLNSNRLTAVAASATIGSGGNGTITIAVDAAGNPGNLYTVTVALGVGLSQALAAGIVGTVVTVTLGTDGAGAQDATKNTATLITAAVDALAGVSATASGNGTGTILVASGPTTFAGGRDVLSIGEIATQTAMNRYYVQRIEQGQPCLQEEAARIAAVLGTTIAGLGGAAL